MNTHLHNRAIFFTLDVGRRLFHLSTSQWGLKCWQKYWTGHLGFGTSAKPLLHSPTDVAGAKRSLSPYLMCVSKWGVLLRSLRDLKIYITLTLLPIQGKLWTRVDTSLTEQLIKKGLCLQQLLLWHDSFAECHCHQPHFKLIRTTSQWFLQK